MAVVLAAGSRPQITLNPLTSVETMTAYIVAVAGGEAPEGSAESLSLFAVGMALFLITLVPERAVGTWSSAVIASRTNDPPSARFDGCSSRTAGSRRVLGPLFGAACVLATSSGVVVLSILLGAVVGAVYRGSPGGSIPAEIRHLMGSLRSNNPEIAGFRAGIAGTLWLLGLVAAFAIPVGVGAAVYPRRIRAPRAGSGG